MKTKQGFTIIEMLISMLIMAIFLIVSLGVGRGTVQRANLTKSINTFIADFNLCRQMAARLNRHVAIAFNNEGTGYQIRVQNEVAVPLTEDVNSYRVEREVYPNEKEQFLTGFSDFSVNSMGIIHAYPVVANPVPITVVLNFAAMKTGSSTETDYQQTMTIFPTGGIETKEIKVQ